MAEDSIQASYASYKAKRASVDLMMEVREKSHSNSKSPHNSKTCSKCLKNVSSEIKSIQASYTSNQAKNASVDLTNEVREISRPDSKSPHN